MNEYALALNSGQMGFGPNIFSGSVYDAAAGSASSNSTYPVPTYSTPVYNPNTQPSGGSSWNWSAFTNNVTSLLSQIVARGGNPTNQIYSGVGVVPNPQVQVAQAQANALTAQAQWGGGQNQSGYNTQGGGGALESLGGSLASFVSQNGVLVVGGIVLFMLWKSGRK